MTNYNLFKRKALWLCSFFVTSETWMSCYLPNVLMIIMPNRTRQELKLYMVWMLLSNPGRWIPPLALSRKTRLLTTQSFGLVQLEQLPKMKGLKSCTELHVCLWKILEVNTGWAVIQILRTCDLHGHINLHNWQFMKPLHLAKVYLLEKWPDFIWRSQEMEKYLCILGVYYSALMLSLLI